MHPLTHKNTHKQESKQKCFNIQPLWTFQNYLNTCRSVCLGSIPHLHIHSLPEALPSFCSQITLHTLLQSPVWTLRHKIWNCQIPSSEALDPTANSNTFPQYSKSWFIHSFHYSYIIYSLHVPIISGHTPLLFLTDQLVHLPLRTLKMIFATLVYCGYRFLPHVLWTCVIFLVI